VPHIAAAFVVACSAITLVLAFTTPVRVRLFSVGNVFASDLRLVLASPGIALGGFVMGSFIIGLCLLVSLDVFGRHSNEAFSTLAISNQ
jgi:hypothetical protein